MRSLFPLVALMGLLFSVTSFAQEAPPPPSDEAAPASDEAAPASDEAAPASDEAAPAAVVPADDEAALEAPEVPTSAEEAPEAPEVPTSDDEAVKTAMHLLEAVQGGQWPLAVGLLLTLLVYGVNRFALKDKVDEKIIPWIAGGVGFAGAVGTGLASGAAVPDSLIAGAIAAVAAIGGWEALLKHLTAGKAKEAPPAEETAEKTE